MPFDFKVNTNLRGVLSAKILEILKDRRFQTFRGNCANANTQAAWRMLSTVNDA